jgi:YesN/AraC family two-component response regulator
MFELILDSIVTRHLIAIKTASSVEKLISYIDQNPQVNLTLSQAADMMYRSPSSISHEFKRATGTNFKKYLILKKLEKADELMSIRSELKVNQVAKLVGYQDPYLFSRVYKKYRNHSPNRFRSTKQKKIAPTFLPDINKL